MQRLESWLFLENICERIRHEHPDLPLITIHDSILTTPAHVETVDSIIREVMYRWGVPARIKRERMEAKGISEASDAA